MMSVIAARRMRATLAAIVAGVVRFLAVLSFLLMPLGMAEIPATAATQDSGAASSMPCEDHHQPDKQAPIAKQHCMACVALPAKIRSYNAPNILPQPILTDRLARQLTSLVPEVATPPPKMA